MQQLWLVFFQQGQSWAWWKAFLRPGFCHVSAASFYVDADRWVFVDAAQAGVTVEVSAPDAFNGRLGLLLRDSTVILRVPSAGVRGRHPLSWGCVGLVKALLGLRSGALSPYRLYRHLLSNGAEVVEVPSGQFAEAEDGCPKGAD